MLTVVWNGKKVRLKSQDKKWLLKKRMLEIEIMNFDIVGKNEVKDCLWE